MRNALMKGNKTSAVLSFAWGAISMTKPGAVADQLKNALKAFEAAKNKSGGGDDEEVPSVSFSPLDGVEGAEDVEIKLPVTMLGALTPEQLAGMSMVAGLTNDDNAEEDLENETATEEKKTKGVLLIELTLPDGGLLNVTDLKDPIGLALPTKYDPGRICAYWDETLNEWSTRGVVLGKNRTIGGPMRCNTYHLSLFGAILKGFLSALMCANLNMLSAEAMAELFKGVWYKDFGACLVWGIFFALGVIAAVATYKDFKFQRTSNWKDDFFLIEAAITPSERIEEGAPDQQRMSVVSSVSVEEEKMGKTMTQKKRMAMGMVATICWPCTAFMSCFGGSSGFKDAIDDIISNWCQGFSHLRQMCEAVASGCSFSQLLHCNKDAYLAVGRGMSTQMLSMSAGRMASYRTGLSEQVISFVLQDEDLCSFLMDEYSERAVTHAAERRDGVVSNVRTSRQHISRNGEWKKATSHREAWKLLHDEVQHHLISQAQQAHKTCSKSIWAILTVGNPVGEVFMLDIFETCKERALLFSVDMVGTLALSCLFYQASGNVADKKQLSAGECESEEGDGIGEKIGRFLVVALGSVLFAEVPVMILESLQTKGLKWITGDPEERDRNRKKQLRAWAIQTGIFWTVGLAYLAFCVLFVLVFLANIGNGDSEDWFTAGWIALVEDIVALPLGIALVIPVVTKLIMFAYIRAARINERQMIRIACEKLHTESNIMLPIVQA